LAKLTKLARRGFIQAAAALLQNANLSGFWTGRIFRGNSKIVCVPGLNCYSCPGALFSCPIGALQAVAINPGKLVSLYIIGILSLFGVFLGRLVCGFLCPFGWLQELLNKIPSRKIAITRSHKYLIKIKYAVLGVFVLGIPIFYTVSGGIGFPAFCQWICPAGTLEAGIPLVLLNGKLQSAIGFTFVWKCALLVLCVIAAVLIFRPFCKYICPLGAIYALFNKYSIVTIAADASRCNGCGKCAKSCKMCAKSTQDPECIRCGECIAKCPHDALGWQVGGKRLGADNNLRKTDLI
jgi:polyferredoxin